MYLSACLCLIYTLQKSSLKSPTWFILVLYLGTLVKYTPQHNTVSDELLLVCGNDSGSLYIDLFLVIAFNWNIENINIEKCTSSKSAAWLLQNVHICVITTQIEKHHLQDPRKPFAFSSFATLLPPSWFQTE